MSNSDSKQWYQHTVLRCIVAVVVVLVAWFAIDSNKLNNGKQNIDSQTGQVQNVLQRRSDTVTEMVGAVKGAQKHEGSVYEKIAKDRTEYYKNNDKYKNAKSSGAKEQAMSNQSGAVNAMVGSIKEAYPKLSSNSRMGQLMVELEGSNNRVSVERRNLQMDTQSYNRLVVDFPSSIIASLTNHHTVSYFKAQPSAQEAPKVSF